MEVLAPALAGELLPWMQRLAPRDTPPEVYFAHPCAFPLMSLPWYLDEALDHRVDQDLQASLIYSSMCGYYAIRLIDDVMDQSEAAVPHLLPAVCILDAEFQAVYAAFFASDHPFWPHFFQTWAGCHQAAVLDSRLESMDEATFRRVSAKKVSAVTIPMSAVAAFHGVFPLPAQWQELTNELSAWHQQYNDLFDWVRDHANGASTWFLSKGMRCKGQTESMLSWVAREGFDREVAGLEHGLARMQSLARELASPPLVSYFDEREKILQRSAADGRAGLRALRPLFAAGTDNPLSPNTP